MRSKIFLLTLLNLIILTSYAQIWPSSLVGRWTFDNTTNLLDATNGVDLLLTGNHIALPGISANDGAVAISIGSYYTCTHGISSNGGGNSVNEYSIMFDIKVDNPKVYHALFQTNQTNSNDGELFLNPNNQLGISATGYSGLSLKAKEWYRIVVSVDLGNFYRYYVDGKLVLNGTSQSVDGRFALDPTLLLFADDNSEDNIIHVSQVAVFNSALSDLEVGLLGKLHNSNIHPYLQTPTPNSIFVSWNSYDTSSSMVQYGITAGLGNTQLGTFENIGSGVNINRWHTVKISNLQPNTKYYYRCISGIDTSSLYHFVTPPAPESNSGHIRFLKFGDNQTYTLTSSSIADTSIFLLKNLFGEQWTDSITFIMNSGDITEYGSELGRYMNEFFNPFSNLTVYIPTLISIGNHEVESNYFYQFMKYDELVGFNEKYYTINLGNSQFVFMNSVGSYNDTVQSNWLNDQLLVSNSDPNIDFVFTCNHHPAHSELWPDGNTSYVEDNLYPILKNYPKIVMSTHGHSHCYERGTIKSDHSNNWDFRSVICGGAGGALDRWGAYTNQTNYPEIQKSFDHYCFMLVDIDISTQSVETTMYSLGNNDQPRNVEVMDQWHRKLNLPAPSKPDALTPNGYGLPTSVLTASPFVGSDTLMSSQFQLISYFGDFNNPLIDITRDIEDFYGDSGAPTYSPINLNQNIDLTRYSVASGLLSVEQIYLWRMRYRDANLRWSDWSDTLQFIVSLENISDFSNNTYLNIFPNPANNQITLETKSVPIYVEFLNSNGQLLSHFTPSEMISTFDVTSYSSGIYFIKVVSDKGIHLKKFIKE